LSKQSSPVGRMRRLLERRGQASLLGSLLFGLVLLYLLPFPGGDVLFQALLGEKPWMFYMLSGLFHVMLFSTPFFVFSAALSLAYIFRVPQDGRKVVVKLPSMPPSDGELSLVVGELHNERTPEPTENPRWLVIPERGLFTGIAVFGAIGSGKTTCIMHPAAKRILSYGKPGEQIGGLALEVKGDFCHELKKMLIDLGRPGDYIEVNLSETSYRYNPLSSDLDAYALAYGIATLLTSLFGKGREPFWQQAYTNMVKFIILLHRILYDYVTLLDVYMCAINPDLLKQRVDLGEAAMRSSKVAVVDPAIYLEIDGLAKFQWEKNEETDQMESLLTDELAKFLLQNSVLHQVKDVDVLPSGVRPIRDKVKREQYDATRRWFHEDWMRIDVRLRTSIVEGVAFFFSLFDDNPTLKWVFCPPKECFDPVANADGKFGKPLPPFSELIEQGKLVALNFPTSANPGLARMIGTLMKMDFQRAVLGRVQKMIERPADYFRPVLFLCDEYHAFATVGESDPTGDEKFFSLSRQARCIPIVATQSISSLRSALPGETWRTLLQTFRTKIFLSLSDDFSARVASDLCGRDEQLKLSYNFSESGQDARVSILTGRATAHKASITASKNYSVQRDHVFEAKVFSELKNAQAIVLAYDGLNPMPATYCYLKPHFLDPTVSYFEQLRRGEL
jgi:TraM recognition site of TraD and TraG